MAQDILSKFRIAPLSMGRGFERADILGEASPRIHSPGI